MRISATRVRLFPHSRKLIALAAVNFSKESPPIDDTSRNGGTRHELTLDRETTAIDLMVRPLCSDTVENRGGRNRNGIIRYNVASLPFLATISWNNFPRCRRTNESFSEVKNRISRRGHISSVVFIITRLLCFSSHPRCVPISSLRNPAVVDPAVNDANTRASPIIFWTMRGASRDARNIRSSLCHRDRRSPTKPSVLGKCRRIPGPGMVARYTDDTANNRARGPNNGRTMYLF